MMSLAAKLRVALNLGRELIVGEFVDMIQYLHEHFVVCFFTDVGSFLYLIAEIT